MIATLQPLSGALRLPAPVSPPLSGAPDSFTHALQQTGRDRDRAALRESAAQLVSSAFIVPVLNSLRNSPFLEPPFAPNHAEKRFAPLLDQLIADRIVSAGNFPLVDVIVNRLLGAPR